MDEDDWDSEEHAPNPTTGKCVYCDEPIHWEDYYREWVHSWGSDPQCVIKGKFKDTSAEPK